MASKSINGAMKPHAICIPFPAQSHITSMFKLAKLLHHRFDFHITFVNTEFSNRRLLKSHSLKGLPSFKFETIYDGLPPSDNIDPVSLFLSIHKFSLPYLKELIVKLNAATDAPPVSCLVSDHYMSFTHEVAEAFGLPRAYLWTINARSVLATAVCKQFGEKGYLPLTDENCKKNGYLDTIIEDIPNFEGMRLRDIPDFIVTCKDLEGLATSFAPHMNVESEGRSAAGLMINTFEELECDVLKALRSMVPSTFAVGPLNLLEKLLPAGYEDLEDLGSNIWQEEAECLEWLDSKEPNSVIYVCFGTMASITPDQLTEFAWGLANSNQSFLWIVRSDTIASNGTTLPSGFYESSKGRGMVMEWCAQEKVLGHPSIGGFLTHSGWNSTLESISSGVPMICFPGKYDQPTISWECCAQWGIGMEINEVRRDLVESLVRELICGDKGKQMRKRAVEWKELAHKSAENSSIDNTQKLINQVLIPHKFE